jgi:hypothetical protein
MDSSDAAPTSFLASRNVGLASERREKVRCIAYVSPPTTTTTTQPSSSSPSSQLPGCCGQSRISLASSSKKCRDNDAPETTKSLVGTLHLWVLVGCGFILLWNDCILQQRSTSVTVFTLDGYLHYFRQIRWCCWICKRQATRSLAGRRDQRAKERGSLVPCTIVATTNIVTGRHGAISSRRSS